MGPGPHKLTSNFRWARLIRIVILSGFMAFVILYAHSHLKDVISGVKVSIPALADGTTLRDSRLNIQGFAHHATIVSINGLPIPIDQSGEFHHTLLLPPGYTIISVKAEDKFGKRDQKIYHLVYKPS